MFTELLCRFLNAIATFFVVLVILAFVMGGQAVEALASSPNPKSILFSNLLVACAIVAAVETAISRSLAWIGEKFWT